MKKRVSFDGLRKGEGRLVRVLLRGERVRESEKGESEKGERRGDPKRAF